MPVWFGRFAPLWGGGWAERDPRWTGTYEAAGKMRLSINEGVSAQNI